MSPQQIEASGVVLVRGTLRGEPEVLVIHRPRYDDWTIPKGKDDPGETPEDAALRELYEETGYRAVLGSRLEDQEYEVKGRPKIVRYFIGRPIGFDGLQPQDEVDAVEWLPVAKAKKRLTYPRDRRLLDTKLITAALESGTVHLIRHAHAGSRAKWDGDDRMRPLSKRGRKQSGMIAARLAERGVDHIRSSPFIRCVETVEPLAEATGVEVATSKNLAEGADVSETLELIAAADGMSIALCSHGDLIPQVIRALRKQGVALDSNGRMKYAKGSEWEITVERGTPVSARYIPAPDSATS